MRRAAFLAFLLVLLSSGALAASDPGHDTLYIEQTGNSSLSGNLNISEALRVAQRIYGDYIDVRGDGTFTGSASRIIGTSTDLYIESTGRIIFNDQIGTTSSVHVGYTGDAVDLNVTGAIYERNVRVCLANGTNCMSGNNTGNISSVVAGTGVAVTNPNGPAVTVALNTTYVDANYVGQSEYANLDTDSTNDLTTATSWGGDLGGTGSSPTVDDSSHVHDAANITTGTLADARIASAATWNAKAAAGASAACSYGIANITLSSSGVPAVTCAAQQGTGSGDVTDVLAGTGITVTNSGGPQPSVALNTTFTSGYPNWNAAYTHVTTDVIETATDVQNNEADPQVATVTSGNFCKGTGTQVSCTDASTYLSSDVYVNTVGDTMSGDLLFGTGAQVDFFDEAGDKAYWYGTSYGTGIESSTLTDWSASQFRWRVGGASVSTGTQYMLLSSTALALGNDDLTVSFSDSSTSPGTPWMRSNGAYLVINPDTSSNLYLAWDAGAITYVGSLMRIGTGGTPGYANGAGDLYVQNDLEVDANIYAPGADYAELINATEELEAGDVVEAAPVDESVRRSRGAYSTKVVGIISTAPGTILSKEHGDVPLAVAGRVPVKVSAENGPILHGDLLTTASVPGYAMRCADRLACQGAIVGKAMGALSNGTGTITAMVMLG